MNNFSVSMKQKNIELKINDFLSCVILISCLSIGYIDNQFHWLPKVMFVLRLFFILIFSFNLVFKRLLRRDNLSPFIGLVTLFILFILAKTKLDTNNFILALSQLSMPYLLTIYIENFRHSVKILRILNCWKYVLLALIFIDWMTILLYPSGLYTTIYTENWFLGYKTERFVFYLPLVIISAFLSEKKYGKIGKMTYFYLLGCLAALIYCKATSTSWVFVFLSVVFLFLDIIRNGRKIKKIYSFLMNYKLIIAYYAFVTYLVFFAGNSKLLVYILTQVFHKDLTLSTRTEIWRTCFEALSNKFTSGLGFLSFEDYQVLTQNPFATSSHNMVLSILVTSGVIGLVLYVLLILSAFMNRKEKDDSCEIVCSAGILCFLTVGVTSSTLVFSTFAFILFSLLTLNLSKEVGICLE